MNVIVEVKLRSPPTQVNKKEMYAAAQYLTNDTARIRISVPKNKSNLIIAEFTINKSRQIEAVDKIGKELSSSINNYDQSLISFPKNTPTNSTEFQGIKQHTPKQGQYLAFIFYYTKLNGYAPAEADIQKYFKTTPPTVHNMILQLEKKGFIERIPKQARSIRLLLSRDELPDLE